MAYVPRLLDGVLDRSVQRFPALLLTGPRGSGKTTTAVRIASTVLRLDRDEEAAIVAADPDASLRDWRPPVLIDEWQAVPSVLGAVKRAVDSNLQPGQFVITGSVRADMEAQTWPGTGRLVRFPMFGLTTKERHRAPLGETFLDQLAAGGADSASLPRDLPDLRGYVDELLVSGFPAAALRLDPSEQVLWQESYLDEVMTRDAELVDVRRDPVRLRRYFDVLAANTAGVVDDANINEAAGINRQTGVAYERLFTRLSLLDLLPAWWTNRIKRLTQRPKRFIVDAALAAAAVRIDADGIMRDADQLGRLLETYVVAQLRAEAPLAKARPRLYHLRTAQGRQEVDLVAELRGQQLVGIEVKATSTPSRRDARHLTWLRDSVGERFIAGVVLHTGQRVHHLDERITAVPIAALWV